MNHDGTLVFALLTAFWAGTNAIFAGMKLLIERRDAIEIGRVGSTELGVIARRRILHQEWVPIRGSLGVVSAMLGVVIVSIPSVAQQPNPALERLATIVAIVPFLGAIYFLLGGVLEYLQLYRAISNAPVSRSESRIESPPR